MMALLAVASSVEAQFVESELSFPVPVESRMVLPSFAGTKGAVVLAGRSEDRSKQLAIFEIGADRLANAEPVTQIRLPDDVLFYDAGSVRGERTLAFLGVAGVHALDSASGRLGTLVESRSLYRNPSSARLARLDFLMDVNEDGLDDIVLPDFDGLRIFLQTENGFDGGSLLKVDPELSVGAREATYRWDPVHVYDFDADGIHDLAIVRNNEFIVFGGDPAGGFEQQPRTIPIDIPLANDEEARFEQNLVGIDQSDFRLSRISRVADLDGDGLPDLVTFTAISSGVFDKSSEYHVHLARETEKDIRFLETPDASILSSGFQIDLTPVDLGGDGRQDLVSTSVDFGFGELIKALFSRNLDVNIGLHRFGRDPVYSSEADYRAEVKLKFSISTGFISSPAVRFADFNGDGLADLLLQDGTERLEIRLGAASGDEFGGETQEWETRLPLDGSLIEVADANGDGSEDILVGFGNADGEELRNRVKVLISTPAHTEL